MMSSGKPAARKPTPTLRNVMFDCAMPITRKVKPQQSNGIAGVIKPFMANSNMPKKDHGLLAGH